jgi:hypothetical protein
MKTFSRLALVSSCLIGMTGLAAAQAKDAKPAAPAKPEAKPTGDKPAMPEMKPPQQVADVAKATAGTWKCKGQGMDHTMKMADMTGTLKMKLELDNYWLHATFDSKMGKEPFHFESYTTFDGTKWKRVMVESGGGWSSGESPGMKDNKIDWEMTTHSPMGDAMFRDHEDASDAKAGVKMWGEFSMDKGKTWTKVYEMTCKK